MARVSRRIAFSTLTTLVAALLLSLPAQAQYQGRSSAGQTTSAAARGLMAPKPLEHMVVTAVDAEQGKIRLQHQHRGWNLWFELTDDTVIRSASDKHRLLNLQDVKEGQAVSVFIARKLFKGKTIYLNIGET